MRRERDIQAGACHHLVARVAKGESKGVRRYDKESLLWQFTVAIRSDPVGLLIIRTAIDMVIGDAGPMSLRRN